MSYLLLFTDPMIICYLVNISFFQDMEQRLGPRCSTVANQPKEFLVFRDKEEIQIRFRISKGGWTLHQGCELEVSSTISFLTSSRKTMVSPDNDSH